MKARKGDKYEMRDGKYSGILLEIKDVSSEIVKAQVIFPEGVVRNFDGLNSKTELGKYDMPDPELGGEWELTFSSNTLAKFEGTVSRRQFENNLLEDKKMKPI